MIIQEFIMKWQSDTGEATRAMDKLEKRAKEISSKKQSAPDVNPAKADQIRRQERDNAKDLKDAHTKSEGAAKRWQDILKGMKGSLLGGGGSGGSGGGDGGGLSGLGGIMGSGGGFAKSVAGTLPGMRGLVALGGAATVAAGAAMIFAKVVGDANEAAEKSLKVRQEAWETGRNITQYNAQVLKGRALGLNEGEVKSGLTGLTGRIKEAATQPYGEAAMRFRQSGIHIGGASKPGDIEEITKAVEKHIRALAKSKGPNEAIAWATQRMGMSFQMAAALAEATDAQMKEYNKDVTTQAMMMTIAEMKSKQYALAQRELGNSVDNVSMRITARVTPSLTMFTKQLNDSAQKADGLVNVLGGFVKIVIELASTIVELGDKVVGFISKYNKAVMDGAQNVLAAVGIGKSTDEEAKDRNAQFEKVKAADEKRVRESAASRGMTSAQVDAEVKHRADVIDLMQKQGDAAEDAQQSLQTLALEAPKQTKELAAQTKFGTPPVPVQPVTIGLEQALSLWASGIGKAAGLNASEGAAAAGSRSEYERTARAQMNAQRSVAWNPDILINQSSAQRALAGANNAARTAVAPGQGQVTINQDNTYNVRTGEGGGRDVAREIQKAQTASNKQLVNAHSNNLRN